MINVDRAQPNKDPLQFLASSQPMLIRLSETRPGKRKIAVVFGNPPPPLTLLVFFFFPHLCNANILVQSTLVAPDDM